MTLRHGLGDREPEPAALGLRRRRPEETIEQARDVRLGDAATGIDHIEHEAVAVQPHPDVDRASARRIANRVVDQIAEQEGEIVARAANCDAFGAGEAKIDALRLGERNDIGDAGFHQRRNIHVVPVAGVPPLSERASRSNCSTSALARPRPDRKSRTAASSGRLDLGGEVVELDLQGRQRGAQFVRSVGDGSLLTVDRLLQT